MQKELSADSDGSVVVQGGNGCDGNDSGFNDGDGFNNGDMNSGDGVF